MKIKALTAKKQLPRLRRALFYLQVERMDGAGRKVLTPLAQKALGQTLEYWGNSGQNRFPVPRIKTHVYVRRNLTAGKIDLEFHVFMSDQNGQPHFLWHILSQGRGAYTFPAGKKSPPIKARNRRRTRANTLQVDPFPGFSGETFVIHGGQRVKGVAPLNWYAAAAKELQKRAKADPRFKRVEIEFKVNKV